MSNPKPQPKYNTGKPSFSFLITTMMHRTTSLTESKEYADWFFEEFMEDPARQAVSWYGQMEKAPTTGTYHIHCAIKFINQQAGRTLYETIAAAQRKKNAFWDFIPMCMIAKFSKKADVYVIKEKSRVYGPWGSDPEEMKRMLQPKRESVKAVPYESLFQWQQACATTACQRPDGRGMYWWYEKTGKVGKSTMVTFMAVNYGAEMLSVGKTADMVHAYAESKAPMVVCDITRSYDKALLPEVAAALEQIANGMLFNTKYKSRSVMVAPPSITVFANEPPPKGLLSEDRVLVHEIELSDEERNKLNAKARNDMLPPAPRMPKPWFMQTKEPEAEVIDLEAADTQEQDVVLSPIREEPPENKDQLPSTPHPKSAALPKPVYTVHDSDSEEEEQFTIFNHPGTKKEREVAEWMASWDHHHDKSGHPMEPDYAAAMCSDECLCGDHHDGCKQRWCECGCHAL